MNLFQIEFFTILFLPGFLIAFFIGWARSRRGKTTFLKIALWSALFGTLGVAIVFGLLTAIFFYEMRTVITYHSDPPLTVTEARQLHCPIPLPDSAKNIQFAYACGGLQAFEILVRFEALPPVCRAHFQALTNSSPANLRPINSVSSRAVTDMFNAGKTSWFDIQNIVHGETKDNTPYDNKHFWIDDDRGVFYYNDCD